MNAQCRRVKVFSMREIHNKMSVTMHGVTYHALLNDKKVVTQSLHTQTLRSIHEVIVILNNLRRGCYSERATGLK